MLIERLKQLESPSAKAFVKWFDTADEKVEPEDVEVYLSAFLAGEEYVLSRTGAELGKGDGRHEVVEKKS